MILLDNSFWSVIFNAQKIIEVGGLLLLLCIIYIETGFFLGLVLPGGDYMLFAAGLFCGTEYLELPVYWLIALLILASFFGDLTGYFKGKWLGNKLFTDNRSRFFKLEYLERGKKYYDNYGIRTLLFSRFMPVIRTFVPMIAGATVFPLRKFILFDALGALTWVGSLVSLGYFIGKKFPGVINYSIYILLLIVALASFPILKIVFSKKKKS